MDASSMPWKALLSGCSRFFPLTMSFERCLKKIQRTENRFSRIDPYISCEYLSHNDKSSQRKSSFLMLIDLLIVTSSQCCRTARCTQRFRSHLRHRSNEIIQWPAKIRRIKVRNGFMLKFRCRTPDRFTSTFLGSFLWTERGRSFLFELTWWTPYRLSDDRLWSFLGTQRFGLFSFVMAWWFPNGLLNHWLWSSFRTQWRGPFVDVTARRIPDGSYRRRTDVSVMLERISRYDVFLFVRITPGLLSRYIGSFSIDDGCIGVKRNWTRMARSFPLLSIGKKTSV